MNSQSYTKHEALSKYWGYSDFRPLQEEIIESVISGHDTIGLLPTGGGKSLTFQVPGVMEPTGLTLVVTPIISLMKDQADGLVRRGIKATYLHAGLTLAESRRVIEKCVNGNCRFLYVSPERLDSRNFIENLRQMDIRHIVVDEAHCISQWGYDFRPAFMKIKNIRAILPNIPVLALTASATPFVVDDIARQLDMKAPQIFRKSFHRGNLSYIVRLREDKVEYAIHALTRIPGSAIIYVRSRKKTQEIATILQSAGISATNYHAGLSSEEKNDKQNKWISGDIRVIVATNAFGMGIDKPDVRVVIHIDVPSSLEEYYQEAGRAGRDEKQSYVLLLASPADKGVMTRRLNEMFPDKDFVKYVYEQVGNFLSVPIEGGYDQLYDFNFNLFCKQNKFSVATAFNALKILSRAGYLDFIEEVETQSRVMILANKNELYDIPTNNPNLDPIFKTLLRQYSGLFSDYVFINEQYMSYNTGYTAEQIYEVLLELNRKHIIHYIPRKRTPYIYYPTSREDVKYLRIGRQAYEDRRAVVKERMDAMMEYIFKATNDKLCRENIILKYFGELPEHTCGKCDCCIENHQLNNDTPIYTIKEGIMYTLKYKPRRLHEIVDTLSYPKDAIIEELRTLMQNGAVAYDNSTETFRKTE